MRASTWRGYLEKFNDRRASGDSTGHIIGMVGNYDKHEKRFLDVGSGKDTPMKRIVKGAYYASDYHLNGGDIHSLPYQDSYFDVVFCNHTLEHVLSPAIVLAEMSRVMKADGVMIIGVPECPHFLCEEHLYVMTKDGWEQLFKRISLVVHEYEDVEHSCNFVLKKGEHKWDE